MSARTRAILSNVECLIKIRTSLAILSLVAFSAIFIDRVIRGDFDYLSLFYVLVVVLAQGAAEYLHGLERRFIKPDRRAAQIMWEEFQRNQATKPRVDQNSLVSYAEKDADLTLKLFGETQAPNKTPDWPTIVGKDDSTR